MVLVAVFSGTDFRAENSQGLFRWLLGVLDLHLSPAQFAYLHGAIRKSAHFFSYAVMSALLFRAVRGPAFTRSWRPRYALAAMAICLAASITDEFHQTFIPGRTGTYKDVLLDMAGALFAQLVLLSAMVGVKPRSVGESQASADLGTRADAALRPE